ncbi:hypothetical protein VTK56DRAFT_7617 [Thermocarpiscus australiensis]
MLPRCAASFQMKKICESLGAVVACDEPLAFVTGPPGTGKTLAVPLAIAVAGREWARVVCVQPNHRSVSWAYNSVRQHFDTTGLNIATYDLAEESAPPENIQLLYVTYGDLVCNPEIARKLFRGATHVVLDEVHEQSADQELSCALSHKHRHDEVWDGAIVMMTSYEESGTLGEDCLLRKVHGTAVTPFYIRIQHAIAGAWPELGEPRHHYLEGEKAPLDPADYHDWVMKTVGRLLAEPKLRAIVFAPSDQILLSLSSELQRHGIRAVTLNLNDPVAQSQFDDSDEALVILMRPYFSHRLRIKSVTHVLCPAFDEQPILYTRAGKELPTMVTLAEDRIRFLASHAETRQSAVYFAFTREARAQLPSTNGPLLTEGDCLEYHLKAAGIYERHTANFPGTPVRLRQPTVRAQWALRQMAYMDLVCYHRDSEPEYSVAPMGRQVIRLMNCTGLGVRICRFLCQVIRNRSDLTQWWLAIAVLSEFAPPIVQPRGNIAPLARGCHLSCTEILKPS